MSLEFLRNRHAVTAQVEVTQVLLQVVLESKSSDSSRAKKRAKVYRPPTSFGKPSRAAMGQKLHGQATNTASTPPPGV